MGVYASWLVYIFEGLRVSGGLEYTFHDTLFSTATGSEKRVGSIDLLSYFLSRFLLCCVSLSSLIMCYVLCLYSFALSPLKAVVFKTFRCPFPSHIAPPLCLVPVAFPLRASRYRFAAHPKLYLQLFRNSASCSGHSMLEDWLHEVSLTAPGFVSILPLVHLPAP